MSAIAAVIPSWNTAAHLERCLDALAAQREVEIELVVVENGSSDDSAAILARRGVRTVALPDNVGFARAVNLGAAATTAPLVLVLNADCFLQAGCVAALAATLAADPVLGGVQPLIIQAAGADAAPLVYSAGQGLTRSGRAFEHGWGRPETTGDHDDVATDVEEVFGVSGAACLLRRELFSDLGGYDESYFAFFEDVDLNARARLAGWRFALVRRARALHVGHAGWSAQRSPQRFNVELSVRNRLATAVKVLPARGVPGALVLTLRSVLAGPARGSGTAALRGAAAGLHRLPRLLRERRRLRGAHDRERLDVWLSTKPGAGPDPRRASRGRPV